MSNDINALRGLLFDAIRGVRDGSLDLDKARSVSDLAQTIINTAKVEVDFMRQTGADVASGFLALATPADRSGVRTVPKAPAGHLAPKV